MSTRSFRVVWVDDDLKGERRERDRRVLGEELRRRGFENVEVKVFDNASDVLLAVLLARFRCDLIVFDWLFQDSSVDSGTVLTALCKQAPSLPVIIYSSREEAAHAARFASVRRIVDKPDIDTLVDAIVGCVRRVSPVIALFSDLHFGSGHGHGGDNSYETLLESLKVELDGFLADFKPNVVVIAGDLTSSAEREEFIRARKFIEFVSERLSISAGNIFVVPGNHDVFLRDNFSYNNYWDFLNALYRSEQKKFSSRMRDGGELERIQQDDLAWVCSPDGVSATFIGLNSVCVSDLEEYCIPGMGVGTFGSVRTHQLSMMAERLNSFDASDGVRFGVLHHQLFPLPLRTPSEVSGILDDDNRVVVGQASLLNWLAENRIQVVFHGHSHYPAARTVTTHYSGRWPQKGVPIHVISAGALGARYLPGSFAHHHYSLIRIKIDEKENSVLDVRSRVLPLDGNAWISDENMTFSVPLIS